MISRLVLLSPLKSKDVLPHLLIRSCKPCLPLESVDILDALIAYSDGQQSKCYNMEDHILAALCVVKHMMIS